MLLGRKWKPQIKARDQNSTSSKKKHVEISSSESIPLLSACHGPCTAVHPWGNRWYTCQRVVYIQIISYKEHPMLQHRDKLPETKRQTLTSVILLLKFLPHRQTWHWYRKLFLKKIIQTVNPSSYYILRGTAWLPHSYLHYCKHSASVISPFAKLDLFSLLQRDELPSDEGVIERVHICGDEWTPPVHLRSDRMNTFKF